MMQNLISMNQVADGVVASRARAVTHDTPVYFRANSSLVRAAEEKARRDGMSLSELLRAALRDKVREAV